MKYIASLILLFFIGTSCTSQKKTPASDKGKTKVENGTITISNPDLKYEVIIFDIGFESWLHTRAKQRGFYDLSFLENKNRIWVSNWNIRSRAGRTGYDYTIDYHSNIKYGYEVNYMIYNYLLYQQESNNINLN